MSDEAMCSPEEVVTFWCETLTPEDWFKSTPALDAQIRDRFAATHLALSRDIPAEWRATPEARLAALIVLDQFSRNMYRGSPLAFAADWIALREARLAIEAEADRAIDITRRHFFYLPFVHAEDLGELDRSVAFFEEIRNAGYLDYAVRHRDVIAQFGRFPHRNAALGRVSTPAEEVYLATPGSGF